MNPDDEHLFVVRPVEDADMAARRQVAIGAPQKIMVQFKGARMLVAKDLAALRIDAGHDVLDGAVLAGRIHGLEDDEQCELIGGIQALLQCA